MNKTKLEAVWLRNKVSRRQALKELCGSGLAVFVPVLGSYGCASDNRNAENGTGGTGVGDNSPQTSGGSSAASSGATVTGGQNSDTLSRGGASGIESSTSGGTGQSWSSNSAAQGGSTASSLSAQGGAPAATSVDDALGGAAQGGTSQRNASSATTNLPHQGGIGPTGTTQGGASSDHQGGTKSGTAGSSANTHAGANSGGTRSSASSSSGLAGASGVPNFDDAASCKLTTTDIEGPFFIDDDEFPDDESLIRSDVREGLAGCEFRLYFRLLDAKQSCSPIASAELYIWHCNADGYYSGFNGQDPKTPYAGASERTPDNKERFCRGVQSTDARGVTSFVTIYPGWYAGRPLHLHLMARLHGQTTRLITTQLYFPADFTLDVHQSEPAYQARAAAMPAASRNPPSGNPAIPSLTHTPGLVTGTLNVIVNR
ncbi:MAG TPA: hypothetical protein VIV60_30800 [Polyangiaceae bacterium]